MPTPSSYPDFYHHPSTAALDHPAYYSPASPLYYPLASPSHTSSPSPSKRLKVHQDFDASATALSNHHLEPFDYHHHIVDYAVMPQAVPRLPAAPHINLQRASESASPSSSIPSSASNHSTPSPSPSRVVIMSDQSDTEYLDDVYNLHESTKLRSSFHHRLPNYQPSSLSHSHPQLDVNYTLGASSSYPQQEYNLHPSSQLVVDVSKQDYPYSHHMEYLSNPDVRAQPLMQALPPEDEPPALSPTRNTSQSSRPSISETSNHSPATPTHSPYRMESVSCGKSALREDASAIVNAWIDDYLRDLEQHSTVPKLDRTVSDAKQDELFNPGIAPGTMRVQPGQRIDSPRSSQIQTLFQQAQNQHAIARSSPKPPLVRDHSPFRANSPFHPGVTKEVVPSPTRTTLLPMGYATARSQREREQERQAEALTSQMNKEYEELARPHSPKTISPKDAYLDYTEPEDGVKGSLFPSQTDTSVASDDEMSQCGSYHTSVHDEQDDTPEYGLKTEGSFASMATSRRESDVNDVNMEYTLPMFNGNGHQFNGNGHQFNEHLGVPSHWEDKSSHDASSQPPSSHHYSSQQQSSANSTVDDDDDDYDYQPGSPASEKPADSKANSGAYSCTVHGCNQRFATPGLMSKHRRDTHRHPTPLGGRDVTVRSQHQGPHRCTRINPTTNKPCNTVFSRPYDLTRHEDTIHNTRRQKVRCEICNDEKTFSRQDALTRHKKVKHGIDK